MKKYLPYIISFVITIFNIGVAWGVTYKAQENVRERLTTIEEDVDKVETKIEKEVDDLENKDDKLSDIQTSQHAIIERYDERIEDNEGDINTLNEERGKDLRKVLDAIENLGD